MMESSSSSSSSSPENILDRLPGEIIGQILEHLGPEVLTGDALARENATNEALQALMVQDDDVIESPLAVLREQTHRRNLFTLAQVRVFRHEAERILWARYAHVAILHAACTDDEALAQVCFEKATLAALRLDDSFNYSGELPVGTILHIAAWFDSAKVSRILLSHGADMEARGVYLSNGRNGCCYEMHQGCFVTPLGLALVAERTKVAHLLLDSNASLQVGISESALAMGISGFLAVHAASMGSDQSILAKLVAMPSFDPDEETEFHLTPLHWAMCRVESLGNVELLLNAGANPNMDPNVASPLLHHLKCLDAPEDTLNQTVALLVSWGVDIDAENASRLTALAVASREMNLTYLRVLLENGAEANSSVRRRGALFGCLDTHRAVNSGRHYYEIVSRKVVAIIENLFQHGLREDPQGVFVEMLTVNIGAVGQELLMRLASRITPSTGDLVWIFTRVANQPSARNNKGLQFLMDHYIPHDDGTLDACNLFDRLLETPAVGHPCFHLTMGPSFDVNAPLQRAHWSPDAVVPPIVALVGCKYYRHDTAHRALETLIQRGANVQATNHKGENCLMVYIQSHLCEVQNAAGESVAEATGQFCNLVEMLAQHGFDFTAADDRGDTVLHQLATSFLADLRAPCAAMLIRFGASVTQLNIHRGSPVSVYLRSMENTVHYLNGSFGRAMAEALPQSARATVEHGLASLQRRQQQQREQ
ncbi:ankyrin repeats (3 copies) domain-containing protein [Purpureocillium lavendulum]|uniref:Ankyrin repeats (3 copies) domain-containing protein n=1 Tax=Purpureocillium lavendulum TaxID=1247861 RepID=A0AB34FPM5_9HYPO|nr:ankyrin repeats (3 copies) domain-containing protein [Purpureocillium lavendulum]